MYHFTFESPDWFESPDCPPKKSRKTPAPRDPARRRRGAYGRDSPKPTVDLQAGRAHHQPR
eukprot:scaffold96623_cov75-Phaeocystis_antarctica.AAC.1